MSAAAHVVFVAQGSDLWTKLGTIATLLAVLVALFGPLLLDRIRRPRLAVSAASDLVSTLARAPVNAGRQHLTINVINEGRRQANDVQVFLSVDAPFEDPELEDVHRVEAFQAPIPFFHREGGHWTSQFSVAIPPGFSRPLEIIEEDPTGFHLASSDEGPAKPRSVESGLADGDRRVLLDIVGSNFRVIRWEGALRIRNDPREPAAKWIKPLQMVRYRAGDPLPP